MQCYCNSDSDLNISRQFYSQFNFTDSKTLILSRLCFVINTKCLKRRSFKIISIRWKLTDRRLTAEIEILFFFKSTTHNLKSIVNRTQDIGASIVVNIDWSHFILTLPTFNICMQIGKYSSRSEHWPVELQTKVCGDFTITEKAHKHDK